MSTQKLCRYAVLQDHEHIDVLINNAGVFGGSKKELSADGFELTWAVNVLAPFLLTSLLLDKASPNSQVAALAFRASDSDLHTC